MVPVFSIAEDFDMNFRSALEYVVYFIKVDSSLLCDMWKFAT